MASEFLVVTCEHGGNRVPARYRGLFDGHAALLRSHRGYDRGALSLARTLAARLRAPLVSSSVSRLVVELNRSVGHRALVSAVTRGLAPREKSAVLNRYYHPYRRRVEAALLRGIRQKGCVLHLSVHTFTPVLDGNRRRADVGILYDPNRSKEKGFSGRLQAALGTLAPRLRVRRNYPYRGWTDGLTTAMRKRFPASRYIGVEIELNQALVTRGGQPLPEASRAITDALSAVRRLG